VTPNHSLLRTAFGGHWSKVVAVVLVLGICGAAEAVANEPEAPPKNLTEALDRLDRDLPDSVKEQFKSLPEREAGARVHHSLGRGLRNDWGLWSGSELRDYFLGIGVGHPDDMSGIIFTSYWRRLNGKPLEVEKQVACYKRYWEESSRIRKEAEARGATSWTFPIFHCE